MAGRLWTDEEIKILREKFSVLGKEEFIARGLLARSQRAIALKAYELGLKNHCIDCGEGIYPESSRCKSCAVGMGWEGGIYNAWGDDELEILREQYSSLLNRSPRAIAAKAEKLGLQNYCMDCNAEIHR